MSTLGRDDSDSGDEQARYWNEMVLLKAHFYYLGYWLRRDDRNDLWVNYVTTIASSASIGGWLIWQSLSYVWGLIIAASQVLTTVKHLLPFSARKLATNRASLDLQSLFLTAESDWFYVARGMLTAEEIHHKTIELKRGKLAVEGKYLAAVVLPRNNRYERLAAEDAADYFNTTYSKETENE